MGQKCKFAPPPSLCGTMVQKGLCETMVQKGGGGILSSKYGTTITSVNV